MPSAEKCARFWNWSDGNKISPAAHQNAAGLYCIRKGRALLTKPLPYALFQQIVRHLRDHGVVVSILTALPDDQTGNALLLDEVQLVL